MRPQVGGSTSADPAANPAIAGLRTDAGCATPRIAVSGQVVTQLMQPTQRSGSKAGMRGARVEKSRTAAVPGGMTLRATPASAGRLASAVPAR